jgi:hypothetical protein
MRQWCPPHVINNSYLFFNVYLRNNQLIYTDCTRACWCTRTVGTMMLSDAGLDDVVGSVMQQSSMVSMRAAACVLDVFSHSTTYPWHMTRVNST